MHTLRIELDTATFEELCALAREERRRPADQVAWIIQQAVKTRIAHARALRSFDDAMGVIPPTPSSGQKESL